MGKKDNRYAFMNPIAMARSQRRQVSGPTLTDYFNRERMSWEEVKALLEKRKEKTNSLAAFEDHDLNLLHKAALERRREKLLAKAEEQGPAFVYEPVEKNVKNSDSDSSSSDADSQPSKSSSSRKRKRKDRKKDKRKSKKRKKSKRGGSNNSGSDSDSVSDSMPSSSDDSDTERRRRKKKRKEKKSKKRRD